MEQIIKKSTLLLLVLISFNSNVFAQSDCWTNGFYNRPAKETSGGRYSEPNDIAGHPYTVFDKRKPGWTLSNNITEIRNILIEEFNIPENEREFLPLYEALYNFAMQPYSSQTIGGGSGSSDGGGSTLASWAKANAFCYLIKLNASAEDISSYIDTLNLLKEHCLTAFENMN